jgi:gas vesicle protein
MGTTTLKRRAEEQGKRVRSKVEGLGHEAGSRARGLTKEARSRARDLRGEARSRSRDLRKEARTRARDLRKDVRTRSRATRRRVGYWIAGEKPAGHPARWAVLAGAVGAAAAFFLDPVSGKRRRHVARDWAAARFRRLGRRTERAGRAAGAHAYGAWQSARHRVEASAPENDQTLAHKVESEVFRGSEVPGSRILVNADNGVVVLRGVVGRPEEIQEIEDRVRRVHGVRGVDNRMHVEGTPAPMG